jgi:hypothetical protein
MILRDRFEENKLWAQYSLDIEYHNHQHPFDSRLDRIRPQNRRVSRQKSCHAAEDNGGPHSVLVRHGAGSGGKKGSCNESILSNDSYQQLNRLCMAVQSHMFVYSPGKMEMTRMVRSLGRRLPKSEAAVMMQSRVRSAHQSKSIL